jgi:hypothetical protein
MLRSQNGATRLLDFAEAELIVAVTKANQPAKRYIDNYKK